MDILVVGGGGREHAVIKALRRSRRSGKIYALPGNGGIAADAECVPVKATDVKGIVAFAREKKVDFAVVTPDDPLVLGCVDALEAAGVPCFGPNKDAAKSTFFALAKRTMPSMSVALTGTHSASAAMPPFPGSA